MKNLFEKKFNKTIIGVVLGTAVLGLGGWGMSPKGKSFFKKMKEKLKSNMKGMKSFMGGGMEEFKKNVKKTKNLSPKKRK